jgi:hypothetical protein
VYVLAPAVCLCGMYHLYGGCQDSGVCGDGRLMAQYVVLDACAVLQLIYDRCMRPCAGAALAATWQRALEAACMRHVPCLGLLRPACCVELLTWAGTILRASHMERFRDRGFSAAETCRGNTDSHSSWPRIYMLAQWNLHVLATAALTEAIVYGLCPKLWTIFRTKPNQLQVASRCMSIHT